MSRRCATRLRLPSHSRMVRAMRSRSMEARESPLSPPPTPPGGRAWLPSSAEAFSVPPLGEVRRGLRQFGLSNITALSIVCSNSLIFPGQL